MATNADLHRMVQWRPKDASLAKVVHVDQCGICCSLWPFPRHETIPICGSTTIASCRYLRSRLGAGVTWVHAIDMYCSHLVGPSEGQEV